MNPLESQITGKLICLARATDGNEHLITDDCIITKEALIYRALIAIGTEDLATELLYSIAAELQVNH